MKHNINETNVIKINEEFIKIYDNIDKFYYVKFIITGDNMIKRSFKLQENKYYKLQFKKIEDGFYLYDLTDEDNQAIILNTTLVDQNLNNLDVKLYFINYLELPSSIRTNNIYETNKDLDFDDLNTILNNNKDLLYKNYLDSNKYQFNKALLSTWLICNKNINQSNNLLIDYNYKPEVLLSKYLKK